MPWRKRTDPPVGPPLVFDDVVVAPDAVVAPMTPQERETARIVAEQERVRVGARRAAAMEREARMQWEAERPGYCTARGIPPTGSFDRSPFVF
jgi:hypothetical protein